MKTNAMRSTQEMRNHLRNHDASLGGRMVNLFYVRAVTCCELDNGFLVGCQVAKEHGNVEVLLAPPEVLPAEFTKGREPAPRAMTILLVGRKFRGLVAHQRSGDVSLDFGRYRLRFDRAESVVFIEIGIDRPESHDLSEDERLSIDDQIRNAQELGGSDSKNPAL